MKLFKIIPLFLLAACGLDNASMQYGYQDRGSNLLGSPKNPSGSFQHSVTKYNADKTSLVSNNENQIKSYINYRLNEWDLYNPNKGKNISRIDIANAANWLIDNSRTEQEIKMHFAGKETLLHMALYAIDNRLNSCFGDGVSSPGNCFVKWRDTNADYFKNISDEFQRYATLISMTDAEFIAANNAKIKFLVDSKGYISGAEITENGNTTEYIAWAHVSRDDKYFLFDKVGYDSVGKTLGLSYSDFGTYSIEREKYDKQTKEESTEMILANMPLAGGYASHKIEKSDIANNVILYRGQAVGNASDAQHIVDLLGGAILAFDKESGTSPWEHHLITGTI